MPIVARTMPVTIAATAALVGLLAVVNPKLAVAGALALAFGLLMLADIRVGLCLFAFAAVLLESIEIGVSADKLVGMTLALSWFASLAVRRDLRDEIVEHTPGYLALVVLLGAWYTASVTWADSSSEASRELIRLGPNLLIIPIAVSAINDARTLRWVIAGLLLGVLYSVLSGIVFGSQASTDAGRLAGSDLDANSLALWLIMAAALAYGVIAGTKEPALRLLTCIGIALCGIAVLATGSRTGLVALGAVLLVAPLFVARGRRLIALAFAVLAVGASTVYITTLATDAVRERISTNVNGGSGRTSIWKVGVRMVEANPVGGVGGANFQTSSIHYLLDVGQIQDSLYIVDVPKGAHNTYLQVVAETGFVGGALFFSILGLSFAYTLRAARHFAAVEMRELEALARGALLAFVGVAVGAAFISVDNSKPLWLLIALGPVMMKLARRHGLST